MRTKTGMIILAATLLFATRDVQAQAVRCEVDGLTDKWLEKHTAALRVRDNFVSLERSLKQNPPQDDDYKPEHFGGEEAKKDFTRTVVGLKGQFGDVVVRAALLAKQPCYVCLIKSSYDLANIVKDQCPALIAAVKADPDVSDEGAFNCDKVRDFTREDMEAPELNYRYWRDVESDQRHLDRVLKDPAASAGTKLYAVKQVRSALKKFVEFHESHKGDAAQLAKDIKAVGDSCTVRGQKTVLFRID